MASPNLTRNDNPVHNENEQDDDMLAADDAAEEIEEDEDHPMEDEEDGIQGGPDEEELQLQNDSSAHFDTHTDSIFCIAQHPLNPNLIITGGGDDVAYIFDISAVEAIQPQDRSVLPSSYESDPQPQQRGERKGLEALQKLDGHTDSVNAVTFTYPKGEYAVTAGLDGKLRAWKQSGSSATKWDFIGETSEVEEINWVAACPSSGAGQENIVALGANDGSVWVYQINAADQASPLTIVQAFYLHTQSCTAGAWTPDGKMLATVSEDGSLHVWDIFESRQALISLTAADQRFEIVGGLYSVACTATLVAVGGAEGNVKVVGLPQAVDQSKQTKGGVKQNASSAGQILAALQAQSDGVETLSFSSPPLSMLAAGSVDGSIALFDTAHRFALRRHIKEAHEEYAVVKVDFVRNQQKGGWVLTSAGMDGVVRRWDIRGGTAAAGQGFVGEWRGHRGDGEGGGVLGFVHGGGGNRIVTAGDDGIALVFKADL